MKLGTKSFKELTKNGQYKYKGFVLISVDEIDGNEKILGVALLFFMNEKTQEIFYVENTSVSGVSTDSPYGVFSGSIGKWNSNFDIEINEGIYLISY